MKHIDILINVVTLLSGLMTALLGFLLYLKYRIKVIRYYSLFILTTTFTVAFTTVYSYISNSVGLNSLASWQIPAFLLFEVFLLLINYAFSMFALGIINKSFGLINKILVGIPCFFIIFSFIIVIRSNIGKGKITIPPIVNGCFMIILGFLFLSFVIYSCQIALNLKNIKNPDLKRALKVFALLFMIDIPIQALVIRFNGQWVIIMLTRNLFYFSVNVISIIFAAKYFFVETPSITDQIEVSDCFLQKYAITDREKEVIELLLSGLSIKEIGGKLDRSHKTINNHIYNIYKKTNVSSKMELLNVIIENKI